MNGLRLGHERAHGAFLRGDDWTAPGLVGVLALALLAILAPARAERLASTEPIARFGIGQAGDAAWSPDGAQLITAGPEGGAYVWDTSNGHLIRQLPGLREHVSAVDWSPDGQYLLTAGHDGLARLWRATDGTLVRTVGQAGTDQLYQARFAPDGTSFATGGKNGACQIWQTANGDRLTSFTAHANGIYKLEYAADGTSLLTACYVGDPVVKLWTAASGQLQREINTGNSYATQVVRAGSDKALSLSINSIDVWSTTSSLKLRRFTATDLLGTTDTQPYYQFKSVTVLPSQQAFLLASQVNESFRLTLHDLTTGARLRAFTPGHFMRIFSARLDTAAGQLQTMAQDGTLRRWNFATGQNLATLELHDSLLTVTRISADGTRLLASFDNQKVRVWDTRTGAQLCVIRNSAAEPGQKNWADLSPDGQRVITTGQDGYVRLWNATTGAALASWPLGNQGYVEWVGFLHYSPDGSRLVVTYRDSQLSAGQIVALNASTGQLVRRLSVDGENRFLSTNQLLVDDAQANPGVRIYDLASGNLVRSWAWGAIHPALQSSGSGMHLDCSADGRRVISGVSGEDPTVQVWDPETGQVIRSLPGHLDQWGTKGPADVAISPDGRTALTVDWGSTARLWDLRRNEAPQILGTKLFRNHAAFSQSNNLLATGSEWGICHLWRLTSAYNRADRAWLGVE